MSKLGYLREMLHVFNEVVVPAAVYEEVCIRGQGLPGDRSLREAIEEGVVSVKRVRSRSVVEELCQDLSLGEAEAIALALEEEADFVVLDDRLA